MWLWAASWQMNHARCIYMQYGLDIQTHWQENGSQLSCWVFFAHSWSSTCSCDLLVVGCHSRALIDWHSPHTVTPHPPSLKKDHLKKKFFKGVGGLTQGWPLRLFFKCGLKQEMVFQEGGLLWWVPITGPGDSGPGHLIQTRNNHQQRWIQVPSIRPHIYIIRIYCHSTHYMLEHNLLTESCEDADDKLALKKSFSFFSFEIMHVTKNN